MRFPFPRQTKTGCQKFMSLLRDSTHLDHLLQIHALIVKTPLLHHNRFILAKLLTLCLSNPSPATLFYGRCIFDRIPNPDTFIWNTMIRAYLNAHEPLESIHLFSQMRRVFPATAVDSFTVSLVLQACARSADSQMGKRIHTHVLKLGYVADLFVQTALVEMYAKTVDIRIALQVFEEMPRRDMVSYNVLLAEYVRIGDLGSARKMFDEMPERDLVSWNTLIHGYSEGGDLDAARRLFDHNCERDLVSWSSMITGYARSRRSNEALRLFREMQMEKVVPDGMTMVSVLSSCGDVGALAMGKMVHEYIRMSGIEIDAKLGTSLLDMYAKCGDIENSLEVFNKMHVRDVLTWSAMIIGLANHGCGDVSLDHFSRMLSEGIRPNDITFVGVLSACSHVGLVTKGWAYFTSMNEYGVSPKIEHYGCMVDLLGRAGQLREAKDLIINMPFVPDAVIWRTLLGACRIHRNIGLAEEAIIKLLDLEPHVDGHYVLLSNIYAQGKRWDDVANVRRMMKGKSILKAPGSSSVEVDNMVHEFIAGDRSHPQWERIYEMLAEMTVRLINIGYRPITSLVLQDVDEQAKENVLAHHSEKLAIAFALLNTAPQSPIRIVKNLRVCDDCHSAIKLLSLMYDRKIIVRDRNRFHHFSKGLCSCRDYW